MVPVRVWKTTLAVTLLVTALSPGLLGSRQAGPARQPQLLERLPDRPDAGASYIIYLHGRIIEDQGPRPTHPTYGVYEYRKVLEALAADGAVVVGEQRAPNTDIDEFASRVAEQVRALVAAGVAPERISVVGFSKGGGIAIRASALVRNPRVNFVFLAACGSGDFSGVDLQVWGRILSVYEASDEIGRSCAGLFAKAGETGMRLEMEINVGERHGTFYRPHAEWVDPVRRWVRGAR
jgi:hypothetical protein